MSVISVIEVTSLVSAAGAILTCMGVSLGVVVVVWVSV